MKKIQSLFKRDYEGNRQVYNEIVEGNEWVANGEGVATEKFDGTCCMIKDGKLYKRHDVKPTKQAKRKAKRNKNHVWSKEDLHSPPDGWIAAESEPNLHTGHWPGWLLVDYDKPSDKWHIEGWHWLLNKEFPHGSVLSSLIEDGTYELVGEKVQSNPYGLKGHELWRHGSVKLVNGVRTFEDIKEYLATHEIEGIVWHHTDGRMVKIKRSDFGLEWPILKD